MERKRRNYSKEFKAKVALEALRKREILQELAKTYDLPPNQIVSWKKVIQIELPELFSRKKDKKVESSPHIPKHSKFFIIVRNGHVYKAWWCLATMILCSLLNTVFQFFNH